MSAKTLLIGGPKDGDLREVEYPTQPVFISESPGDGFDVDDTPFSPARVNITVYHSKTLSFFRVPLQVHVHESIINDSEALRMHLAKHLLSENGKAVML